MSAPANADRALLPGSYVGPEHAGATAIVDEAALERLVEPLLVAGWRRDQVRGGRSETVLAAWVAAGITPEHVEQAVPALEQRDRDRGQRFGLRQIRSQRPVITLDGWRLRRRGAEGLL